MNIALWIVAGILALAFVVAGMTKLVSSRQQLERNMAWVKDSSMGFVRLVGLLEVLGAIGLIVPGAFGIAGVLVPWAAIGLAILMAGAVVVHMQRDEGLKASIPAIVLLLLAVFVAWGRFGPYPLA